MQVCYKRGSQKQQQQQLKKEDSDLEIVMSLDCSGRRKIRRKIHVCIAYLESREQKYVSVIMLTWNALKLQPAKRFIPLEPRFRNFALFRNAAGFQNYETRSVGERMRWAVVIIYILPGDSLASAAASVRIFVHEGKGWKLVWERERVS